MNDTIKQLFNGVFIHSIMALLVLHTSLPMMLCDEEKTALTEEKCWRDLLKSNSGVISTCVMHSGRKKVTFSHRSPKFLFR